MAEPNHLVRDLQLRLKALGHDLGRSGPARDGIDGDYGASTHEAALKALGALPARAAAAAPPAAPRAPEPRWLAVGRPLIGTREIPGPKHAGFIAQGWVRLGAPWFNDDETPWCGLFVAHCLDAAGLPIPSKGMFARARSWLDWGNAHPPVLGAVAVFGRAGGGHVGFVVGQSRDNLYILGGNQSNMVSIAPIARSRLLGCRWPASEPASAIAAPPMSGGTISTNEA